ncbi:hypothetical protein GCM10009654_23210 [Streptomyces hebeiensis]|uniref:Secreted protein n=2 Tax=Streptomyces hebeiensis TaxID=229486 RepID=A0ABP4FBV6_9ACTN
MVSWGFVSVLCAHPRIQGNIVLMSRDEGEPHSATSDGASEQSFLQRPQVILGIVGGLLTVVGTVIGTFFLLFPDAQPEPEQPGLEVVAVDLDREQAIAADVVSAADGSKTAIEDWKSSLVSVVLRNPSDDPVLVRRAEVHFSTLSRVGCPYGAGDLDVQARYHFKVPLEKKAPFTLKRAMAYSVSPHGQERIAFTIGPESVFTGAFPTVYQFRLTLHLDDGSTLKVPHTMTYMDPSYAEVVLAAAEEAVEDGDRSVFTTVDCVREQEAVARRLAGASGLVSPELKEYSASLTRLIDRVTD